MGLGDGWKRGAKPAPAEGEQDLFDDDVQKRLEALALTARRAYAGRLRAEHRSKKKGSGIEFADHRAYSPGDDPSDLDWNVYGRTGKLLLRLFEEEEDLTLHILVDTSKSMESGAPRKIDYAKRIAAGLSYIALSNLDRVSIATVAGDVLSALPSARGKSRIFRVLDFLRAARPGGETHLADAAKTFVSRTKKRGIVVLLSDLYDPDGFERCVLTLRNHKHETYLLHVVDPSESRPKLHGDLQLVDAETGESRELTITPALLRRFEAAHAAYEKRVQTFCAEKHVRHVALSIEIPFDQALTNILRRGGLLS